MVRPSSTSRQFTCNYLPLGLWSSQVHLRSLWQWCSCEHPQHLVVLRLLTSVHEYTASCSQTPRQMHGFWLRMKGQRPFAVSKYVIVPRFMSRLSVNDEGKPNGSWEQALQERAVSTVRISNLIVVLNQYAGWLKLSRTQRRGSLRCFQPSTMSRPHSPTSFNLSLCLLVSTCYRQLFSAALLVLC